MLTQDQINGPTDGGSAFPCEQGHTPEGTWSQSFDPGMALRDYFAAKALTGILANEQDLDENSAMEVAEMSYLLADCMLLVSRGDPNA